MLFLRDLRRSIPGQLVLLWDGLPVHHRTMVLAFFRRHKDLKPEGIAELNEAGQKLARVLAEEVATSLDSDDKAAKGASHV